jgi:hypothetical protein
MVLQGFWAIACLEGEKFEEARQRPQTIYENEPDVFFSSKLPYFNSWLNLVYFKENQQETLEVLQMAKLRNSSKLLTSLQVEAMMQLDLPCDQIAKLFCSQGFFGSFTQ